MVPGETPESEAEVPRVSIPMRGNETLAKAAHLPAPAPVGFSIPMRGNEIPMRGNELQVDVHILAAPA